MTNIAKTRETRATICLFLTALIWGFSFAAQVVGMEYMRPLTFNGLTCLIGAVSLVPVILVFELGARLRVRRDAGFRVKHGMTGVGGIASWGRHWKCGLVCGLILFFASNLQQFGVDMTGSAGKSGFITGLYMIIVPIAGIFMRQATSPLTWVGAGVSVVGMYFLCVQDGFGSLQPGDWMLFIGAFFWAAHIIAVGKFAADSAVSPLRLSMVQFLICGALCMGAAFLTEPIEPAMWLLAATPLLYRGLGSIGVAYTLQIVGQRYVAPAKASIIFSLESVSSAIGGFLIIGEVMSGRAYLGCGLIFCGILFSQLPGKRSK